MTAATEPEADLETETEMGAEVEAILSAGDWLGALGRDEAALEVFVRETAHAALAAAGVPEADFDRIGAAVLLTDDPEIADLNQRYRGKPGPTNVLSWPTLALEGAVDGARAAEIGHLGDVALALGVIAREAEDQGKPLDFHLRHLIVHGILHLLGYDHETDEAAAAMESRERAALAALGVADPYLGADDVADGPSMDRTDGLSE